MSLPPWAGLCLLLAADVGLWAAVWLWRRGIPSFGPIAMIEANVAVIALNVAILAAALVLR